MRTDSDRTLDAAKNFMNAINDMGWDEKVFAEVVCREHRYLQYTAFSTFLACIRMWASTSRYDGRNAYAVELSRELEKVMNDFKLSYRF